MAWTVFIQLIECDEKGEWLDTIEFTVDSDEALLELVHKYTEDSRFIQFIAHPIGD